MILDRTITLIKAHTHGGVLHAIGTELRVLEHDAAWLIEQGVAVAKGYISSSHPAAAITNNPVPSSEGQPAAAEPAAVAKPGTDPEPTDTDHVNTGDDHE